MKVKQIIFKDSVRIGDVETGFAISKNSNIEYNEKVGTFFISRKDAPVGKDMITVVPISNVKYFIGEEEEVAAKPLGRG